MNKYAIIFDTNVREGKLRDFILNKDKSYRKSLIKYRDLKRDEDDLVELIKPEVLISNRPEDTNYEDCFNCRDLTGFINKALGLPLDTLFEAEDDESALLYFEVYNE